MELDKLVRSGKDRTVAASNLRKSLRKLENDSDESSFDSTSSRIEFWRDINTSDKQYKRAVFLKRESDVPKQEKAKSKGQPFGR